MVEIVGSMGNDGRYCGAKCHYCGWISQSLDMEEAIRLNTAHEKTHPEYTEPPTLEEVFESIEREHETHDCNPGPCVCVCGCREPQNCRVTFGPLCSTCAVNSIRDGDCDVDPALWTVSSEGEDTPS